MNSIASVKAIRVANNKSEELEDLVAEEVEGRVYIDGVETLRLSTSPHMLKYLGIGYAITHGFDISEAKIVVEDTNVLLFYVKPPTNGSKDICRCLNPIDIKVKSREIEEMFRLANEKANLFSSTGCFHFAALFTLEGRFIDIVEDISRLGALLKLLGKAYEDGVDFRKSIVVLSSRAASEMVKNISSLCIPIAVFRGAPTKSSIEIAEKCGITLIAHLRDNRFNVYSGFDLIEP